MTLYLGGIYDISHRIEGKFLVLKALRNPIKQLSYMLDFVIYIYKFYKCFIKKKKKKSINIKNPVIRQNINSVEYPKILFNFYKGESPADVGGANCRQGQTSVTISPRGALHGAMTSLAIFGESVYAPQDRLARVRLPTSLVYPHNFQKPRNYPSFRSIRPTQHTVILPARAHTR